MEDDLIPISRSPRDNSHWGPLAPTCSPAVDDRITSESLSNFNHCTPPFLFALSPIRRIEFRQYAGVPVDSWRARPANYRLGPGGLLLVGSEAGRCFERSVAKPASQHPSRRTNCFDCIQCIVEGGRPSATNVGLSG
jgi:hypothetical protein